MGPKKLRKDSEVYLIGHYQTQIVGNKLPSNRQVLSVLFYNLREAKIPLDKSLSLTIKETLIFWEKAKIPTSRQDTCISILKKLYNKWRNLQKSANKQSEAIKNQEVDFKNKLDDLFDLSHSEVMSMLSIPEDKEFLIKQRQPGRPGAFGGVDLKTHRLDESRTKRNEVATERKRQSEEDMETAYVTAELASSTESDSLGQSSTADELEPQPSTSINKTTRGQSNFITEKLVSVLDKCHISDRDAVRVLIATAESLGHNPLHLVINRTSIQRCRQEKRVLVAEDIKKRFGDIALEYVEVHWDGKLLPDMTGKTLSERLPIIITSGETEQILSIPKLPDSSGKEQARAIYEALKEWNLEDKVQVLCCDTTASNLGRFKGAAILLEHHIGRELLYLPCRHHIFEIVLRAVFEIKMPKAIGPSVPIFLKFQASWPKIQKQKFHPAEEKNLKKFGDQRQRVIIFAEQQLKERQPRDDYKELLELTILFLGGSLEKQVSFRIPGAIHHARWMSKAIYSLKMYLFRKQFLMTAEELKSILDICLFVTFLYIEAWYTAPVGITAPRLDLSFIKKLLAYQKMDPEVSSVASKKIVNHLWYLSEEAVGLGFFDRDIPNVVKSNMVKSLTKERNEQNKKKFGCKTEDLINLLSKELDFFVSEETQAFFERFQINESFLCLDPSDWWENENFQDAYNKIKFLKVVNDTAERGVKLMGEYNNKLTKNEDQKQFIIQVVKDYKSQFPKPTKECLLKTHSK